MESLRRLDKWMLLTAVVSLAAVAFFIVQDDTRDRAQGGPGKGGVGKIVSRINDVRRKSEQELSWSQVPSQEMVYRRDHVFTGERSQAEIELRNGASLVMGSNSLIVIDDGSDQSEVNLEVGGFLSKLRQGKSLWLRRKDTSLELKGTSADTQVEVRQVKEGSFNITVLAGALELEQNGRTTELKQNQALVFAKDEALAPEIVSFPVVLLAPRPGDLIWSESKESLKFAWQGTPGATGYDVELSTDPSFSKIVRRVETHENKVSLEVPEGEIYWRVTEHVASGHEQNTSPVAPFMNYRNSAPESLKPNDGEFVKAENAPELGVELGWTYSKPYEAFEIEVATDESFKEISWSGRVFEPQATTRLARESTYYWRVRAIHKNNASPAWSGAAAFKVRSEGASPPIQTTQIDTSLPGPVASLWEEQIPSLPEPPVPVPMRSPTDLDRKNLFEVTRAPADESPSPAPMRIEVEKALDVVGSVPVAPVPPPPEEALAPAPAPAPIDEVPSAKLFWLWLGLGENYQYYQQSVPSLEGDTKFQNISGPSLLLRGGFQGEKWGFDASYKDTPGSMESSESVQVQDGDYKWRTLSSEVLYRSGGLVTNWRFGVQQHMMPFMYLNAAESLIEVKKHSVTLVTAGFENIYPLSEKTRFEWMMRYQHPLASGAADGADFKVSPQFAFDGSIGGVYSVTERAHLGLYWYGQWHQYDFTYAPIGEGTLTGSQTLFYSNLELRLGVEF